MSVRVTVRIEGTSELGEDYAAVPILFERTIEVPTGSSAGQSNKALFKRATFTAGQTLPLNIDSLELPDQADVTSDATALVMLSCEASNGNSVSVKTGASNGFASFLGADCDIPVGPGGLLLIVQPNGIASGPTNRAVDFVNDDASNPATCTLSIFGRKAE